MKTPHVCAVLLLVAAIANSSFAQIRLAGQVYAFDSAGRSLGVVTPIREAYDSANRATSEIAGLLRFDIDGHGLVFLAIGRFAGGITWRSSPIYYVSTDCSGDAYGSAADRSIGAAIGLVGVGNALYGGDSDPRRATQRIPHSRTVRNSEGGIACAVLSGGETLSVHPLTYIADLDDFFTPPFTLRAATSKARAVRR